MHVEHHELQWLGTSKRMDNGVAYAVHDYGFIATTVAHFSCLDESYIPAPLNGGLRARITHDLHLWRAIDWCREMPSLFETYDVLSRFSDCIDAMEATQMDWRPTLFHMNPVGARVQTTPLPVVRLDCGLLHPASYAAVHKIGGVVDTDCPIFSAGPWGLVVNLLIPNGTMQAGINLLPAPEPEPEPELDIRFAPELPAVRKLPAAVERELRSWITTVAPPEVVAELGSRPAPEPEPEGELETSLPADAAKSVTIVAVDGHTILGNCLNQVGCGMVCQGSLGCQATWKVPPKFVTKVGLNAVEVPPSSSDSEDDGSDKAALRPDHPRSEPHVEHAKQYVRMAMNDPPRFGCDESLTVALKALHATKLALKSHNSSASDKQSSTSRAASKKKRLDLQHKCDQARRQLDDLGPIMNHVDPAMITKRFLRSHVPGQQNILIKRLDAEQSLFSTGDRTMSAVSFQHAMVDTDFSDDVVSGTDESGDDSSFIDRDVTAGGGGSEPSSSGSSDSDSSEDSDSDHKRRRRRHSTSSSESKRASGEEIAAAKDQDQMAKDLLNSSMSPNLSAYSRHNRLRKAAEHVLERYFEAGFDMDDMFLRSFGKKNTKFKGDNGLLPTAATMKSQLLQSWKTFEDSDNGPKNDWCEHWNQYLWKVGFREMVNPFLQWKHVAIWDVLLNTEVHGSTIFPAKVVSDFNAEIARLALDVSPDAMLEKRSWFIHGNIHCGGKVKSLKDRNPAVFAALQKAYVKNGQDKDEFLSYSISTRQVRGFELLIRTGIEHHATQRNRDTWETGFANSPNWCGIKVASEESYNDIRDGPTKYKAAFYKAVNDRATNPGGRVVWHAHCYRLLMFADANFAAYVWNKQGDLWLTDRHDKDYGDVQGQENLEWLFTKWDKWVRRNWDIHGRRAQISRRTQLREAVKASSKKTTKRTTQAKPNSAGTTTPTPWYVASQKAMRNKGAKRKFSSHGVNGGIASKVYNGFVNKIAAGDQSVLAMLQTLETLNVKVIKSDGDPVQSAKGAEVTTKDYKEHVASTAQTQLRKINSGTTPTNSPKRDKKLPKSSKVASPSTSSESDDELPPPHARRVDRDHHERGFEVENREPQSDKVISMIHTWHQKSKLNDSTRDRLLKVDWASAHLANLPSRTHAPTADKSCAVCKGMDTGNQISPIYGVPHFKTHKTITCVFSDFLSLVGRDLYDMLEEGQCRALMWALQPLQGTRPWQNDMAANEAASDTFAAYREKNPKVQYGTPRR